MLPGVVVDAVEGVVDVPADGVVVVVLPVVDGVVDVGDVVPVVEEGVVEDVDVSAGGDAVPQMSSFETFAASPFAAAPVAGVVVVVAGVVVDVVVGVVLVAGGVAAVVLVPLCRSFSLRCRSAISESLSVIRRSVLPLVSSSSLTRDLSSPASCSRLVSASFVRASSDFSSAEFPPEPAPLPGRSAIATLSLPAFGGTSSRRSLGVFDAVDVGVLVVVFAAGVFDGGGVGVPVSAISVGFAAAPPRQSSIC